MTQFLLIGHPVGHSVSPAIHRAAYGALGIQGADYGVLDCPGEIEVRAVVERLRSGELEGVNVTVPHKTLALSLADRADESARAVGAANVLARVEGQIVAYNTDAPALAEELLELVPTPNSGALVLGSGGAALAAVVSARMAGFSPVFVTARRFSSEVKVSEWPYASLLIAQGARPEVWPLEASSETRLGELLSRVEVVIQATSAGMKGTDSGESLTAFFGSDQSAKRAYYDLIYNPSVTPLLREAQRVGVPSRGGLGMLVRQAARAIEIWLGQRPDFEPLLRAAENALGLGIGARGP